MKRMRGGYAERPFVIKFRADAELAGEIQRLADESRSTIARVVRDLVVREFSRRAEVAISDVALTKRHASPVSDPTSANSPRKNVYRLR